MGEKWLGKPPGAAVQKPYPRGYKTEAEGEKEGESRRAEREPQSRGRASEAQGRPRREQAAEPL